VELDDTPGRLAQYAFDASNYRVLPMAVAFPRSVQDVQRVVRACDELGVAVTCRGGGTSLAGNAVGPGVVLDFSRHMRGVVAVDPQARTAVVQPGAVLDALCREARRHGLTFGPDPSSHSRCTLGGMIGNDACGNHSIKHGRTGDHVVSLRVVLADGTLAVADHSGLRAVEPAEAERVASVERELRELVVRHMAQIRVELGRIPRQVSGYQLQHLLPENGFAVARALVGTEGTCAVVVEATVRLVQAPPYSHLVVIGYDDLVAAARDVPGILRHGPSAVEGMDVAIVETMRRRRGAAAVGDLPDGSAWLYVEFDGEDPQLLVEAGEKMLAGVRADGRLRDGRAIIDASERSLLWRAREDGAGLSARLETPDGRSRPSWPGWEDAAVAPENLADYLADFRDLLAEFDLTTVTYGHFGAGCVHARIDFDPSTEQGRAVMGRFLQRAAETVVRHGGTLSGEHGDGRARSEQLSAMYSPELRRAFSEFRRVLDPRRLLNPGVVDDPAPATADLALAQRPIDLGETVFALHGDGGFTEAVRRCVGVGRCRSGSGGFMCPSYRASLDETESTRGRARVLQDMATGALPGGWRSEAALDALDLCLSCKACSTDCPVGVDMATYKAEFLHHHWKGRLRPASHYSLGWLPLWSRLAGWAPGPVNGVLAGRLGPVVRRLGGVAAQRSTLPEFRPRSEARQELARLREAADTPSAVLFVDSFTQAFRPSVIGAAGRVLAAAGVPAHGRAGLCCGLTWVTTGQLGVARAIMARTVRALSRGPGADLPLVVLEPSCASALREDVPELLGTPEAREVAARVRTLSAMLAESDPGWTPASVPGEAFLQTHCHEYSTFRDHTQAGLLRSLGVDVREAEGCCGLAGNFGFEAEHYGMSMDVAEHSLRPGLAALSDDAVVLADGFSCQTQITHLSGPGGPRAVHLAELLDPLPPTGHPRSDTCAHRQ
jgi:FAD/FMN-containing dehydrogenase/Fe-S oxidoreductase